ncbi:MULTISPECIES: hypothetical protein [unclassified Halorhabdus]|uniref:hypothetical protein n=1 Tax=unclassified Halorhabdus TaxID=2621901 RepID=UPI0023DA71FE|nr:MULTISPECIES: hypothetical protein [unclassified Halorhabdus]WEL16278.1 putative membrane protein [Halorhabdus sp. SVX81]WEL20169.1 putative membrane protein [Halorhabdus sp. BNX81]
MNQRLARRVRQLTGVAFLAGVLLIGLGVAGQSGSMAVGFGLLAVGALALSFHHHFTGLFAHPAADAYLASVPAAPVVAGAVVLWFAGASPGELQTLGGLLGLLSLVNHLLRPVYGLGYRLIARVV